MKTKNLLLSLGLGAVVTLGVSSCSDYTEWSEDEIKHDVASMEYAKNFVDHFGQPDPNHTWGMAPMAPIAEGLQTRSNVANKNEWEDVYHLEVPGWPDIYRKENDPQIYNNGYHYFDTVDKYDDVKTGHSVPAGDVTDEEIQYVSWWFRTHKPAKSEIVHWSDFFIQEISSDWDRNPDGTVKKIATRVEYKKVEEEGGVYKWVTTHPELESDPNIDYFNVKTLGNNFDHIYNFNSGSSNNIFGAVKVPMGSNERTSPWNSETETIGSTTRRMCDFYTSSGTEDFLAHYSNDNTDRNDTWTIVHLSFVGKSGRLYDGWYLGFDYELYKEELWFSAEDEDIPADKKVDDPKKYVKYDRDGYYSNWIVKITPATPIVEEKYTAMSRRVMCEDLGNTFDFDFNDVVFDATYNMTQEEYAAYYNGTKTTSPIDVTITLQAAGGTMPIYVGKSPSDDGGAYEAHNMLSNNPSNVPINVGGKSSPVAIYHIKITVDPSNPSEALNLNSIPITVINGGSKYAVKNNTTNYANNDHPNHYNPSNIGTNNTPQKFATPTNVLWMKELKFIETSYPKFCDWVKSEHGKYRVWYEDTQRTTNEWSPWFANENRESVGNLTGGGTGFAKPSNLETLPEPGQDPVNPNAPVFPSFSMKIGDTTIDHGGSYSVALGNSSINSSINDFVITIDNSNGDYNSFEITSSDPSVARFEADGGIGTYYNHGIVLSSAGTTTITVTHKALDGSAWANAGGRNWKELSKTFTLIVTDGSAGPQGPSSLTLKSTKSHSGTNDGKKPEYHSTIPASYFEGTKSVVEYTITGGQLSCGAAEITNTDQNGSFELTGDKLATAKTNGLDCIIWNYFGEGTTTSVSFTIKNYE